VNGIEFLLDTNIVIGLLKGNGPAVELAERVGLRLDRAADSQITRIELLGYPGLTEAEEAVTRQFLARCEVFLPSEAVEAETIRLRRSTGLKLPDAIVLASARVAGVALLTLDQRLSSAARAQAG
jgi:predicted nucleic acid-binding protein